jgi:homoserine kinase
MRPMPRGRASALHKGLPLGSGLGSSGASACAAAVAVDAVARPVAGPLTDARRGLHATAEGVACGTPHPDNVAPCGRGRDRADPRASIPCGWSRCPSPEDLWFWRSTPPACQVATADARAVLPQARELCPHTVAQAARLGLLLVHALHVERSVGMLGEADRRRPSSSPRGPAWSRATVEAKIGLRTRPARSRAPSAGPGPTTFALSRPTNHGPRRPARHPRRGLHLGVGVAGLGDRRSRRTRGRA